MDVTTRVALSIDLDILILGREVVWWSNSRLTIAGLGMVMGR